MGPMPAETCGRCKNLAIGIFIADDIQPFLFRLWKTFTAVWDRHAVRLLPAAQSQVARAGGEVWWGASHAGPRSTQQHETIDRIISRRSAALRGMVGVQSLDGQASHRVVGKGAAFPRPKYVPRRQAGGRYARRTVGAAPPAAVAAGPGPAPLHRPSRFRGQATGTVGTQGVMGQAWVRSQPPHEGLCNTVPHAITDGVHHGTRCRCHGAGSRLSNYGWPDSMGWQSGGGCIPPPPAL